MTLPTSGALTLADIQTEFGGSNPISLDEYYAGGSYVAAGTSGTNGSVPSSGTISVWNFYGTSAYIPPTNPTQKAIFGYGQTAGSTYVSMTNLVSNTGSVATDTTGVGTERWGLAAAGYGGDKAIFGYGVGMSYYSLSNLVSNLGVVAADTTGVGTARSRLAAATYGGDKAIFGFGTTDYYNISAGRVGMTNLVTNTGVVATDTTAVGSARGGLAAAGYGSDKAIFGYGSTTGVVSITNLVSNVGVVQSNVTSAGPAKYGLAAAGYGVDKAIFAYGYYVSYNTAGANRVSSTGVVASDSGTAGTTRREQLAAATYAGDKAIFGYGYTGTIFNLTNLVSNVGVISTNVTGVGTARYALAAASYSS